MSRSARLKADPVLYPRYKSARAWAIGGGVTGAVGLALALNGLAMLAVHAASPVRGDTFRNVGLATTGIGVVAFTAGAAIMGVGLHRRARVLDDLDAKPTMSVAPVLGPHQAGASMSLRF